MAVGYVLLNVVPGKEHDVYLHLKDQDNVADVTVLFGDYDLIVKLVAEDLSSIATAVVESIRQIPGIFDSRHLQVQNSSLAVAFFADFTLWKGLLKAICGAVLPFFGTNYNN